MTCADLMIMRRTYTLTVRQQPERARLCSYKEENETIDRRPVDPPPVVELKSDQIPLDQLLESTSFFIRATIVASSPVKVPFPDHGLPSILEPYYQAIKTPTGADATTGEVVQTPEKLRLLDGKPGAICIFAKLSVRVPGVFRLMFTLYDTTEAGVVELTRTVSEPFEVFSPKLFKGMHESTPLTRHLAAQGVKVKLRTDTSVGRQSTSRKRTPANHSTTTDRIPSGSASTSKPNLSQSSSSSSSIRQSPLSRPRSISQQQQQSSGKGALTSTRSLVWRHPMDYYGYSHPDDQPQTAVPGPGPSTARKRRFVDDGLIPSLKEISSKYDFTPTLPATDLAAFSLSRTSTHDSPTYRPPSRQPSPPSSLSSLPSPFPSQIQTQNQQPNYPHPPLPSHRSSDASTYNPNNTSSTSSSYNSPLSMNGRSAPSSQSSIAPSPFPRLNIGPGDDGIPILPLPSLFQPSISRSPAPFIPPSVNQILDRERDRDRDRQHRSPSSPLTATANGSISPFPISAGGSSAPGISPRSLISPSAGPAPFGQPLDLDGGLGSPRDGIYPVNGGGRGMQLPLTLPPIRQNGSEDRYADRR
ncbi:hypothetical protein I302_109045 [Kwoniella bestiolae CBS 10118]|uniref:Velvet domain-containing protein n=1 Tax=Kwoniella bestiolae CBS 10118 TaxID=1296100 RepID=A0A1B9FUU3_9TREE|nr:hypothetical protein I302_08189 [Kwoniella bestiolae CBS 10118]OCF22539.1 hypothetical protein I302_08189 [Kwoniella bestiolae CBS 10118]